MIVLDASALVDICVQAPLARWVESRMRGQDICAPAHQPSEVLSAVARLTRAGTLTGTAPQAALDSAMELNREVVPITKWHLHRAMALSPGIRVVDGLYVAVAEERGCAILTTDLRLARSVTTCEVLTPA